MRALAITLVLAACGDNRLPPPGYDSSFDDNGQLRVFGDVRLFSGPFAPTPLAGVEVCLDDTCQRTAANASFVLTAIGGTHEAVLAVHDVDVPTLVPVVAGTLGVRNLSTVVALAPNVIATAAGSVGVDAALATHGIVVVIAERFDTGMLAIAIDGYPTYYVGASGLPDPNLTSYGTDDRALFLAVAPGEVILRSTIGHCERDQDGWPASAGEIRAPVVAGAVTLIRPLCIGE